MTAHEHTTNKTWILQIDGQAVDVTGPLIVVFVAAVQIADGRALLLAADEGRWRIALSGDPDPMACALFGSPWAETFDYVATMRRDELRDCLAARGPL